MTVNYLGVGGNGKSNGVGWDLMLVFVYNLYTEDTYGCFFVNIYASFIDKKKKLGFDTCF